MDIDLWLIEHSMKTDFKGDTLKDVDAIPTQDLKELLKTHSIVPNEPTEEMLDVVRRDYDGPDYCFTETYKAMLKAAQENS